VEIIEQPDGVMNESEPKPSAFVGSWDVTVSSPIGKIETVFEISETGGTLAGIARSNKEVVEFLDPIVDGDSMTWTQKVTKPMRLNLAFNITIHGDTFTGTAKAGRLPASGVNGTRR
jgi:hypothetical protein